MAYKNGKRINYGSDNPNWKGGRRFHNMGYVLVKCYEHPRAKSDGYIYEHILIAEDVLGRFLPDGAVVHHVNHITSDNRKENLVICNDTAYHVLLHTRERAIINCGNPNYRPCSFCGEYDDPRNMYCDKGSKKSYYHRSCHAKYENERRREKGIPPKGSISRMPLDEVKYMRDVLKLSYDEIGKRFGLSGTSAKRRYTGKR